MSALGGNLREWATSPVNTGTAVTVRDHQRYLDVTATGSPVSITLPAANTIPDGFVVRIKRNAASDSDVVITGGATVTLTASDAAREFTCDNVAWSAWIIGGGVTDGDKGDITVSSGGAVWTIDALAVSNDKLAAMAPSTFKGRTNTGVGIPEDLNATAATALLNTVTSTTKGLAPASGGGTSNFLRADGTWATPPTTPSAHASSHASGGGDAIKLDDLAAPDDSTDLDVSATAHGLFPKLPSVADGKYYGIKDGAVAEIVAGGSSVFFAKISNSSVVDITKTTTATVNRMHAISGTSADYDISMPSASTGDVVGFYVKDWAAANKAYRLDAGSGVVIAGRSRYLTLLHSNVALLYYDGTDWQPLVLCLDTIWVDGGDFEIYGSTTNPTKGTNTRNQLWRRVGDSCEQFNTYTQTAAGASGTGVYLLPTVFTVRTGHPVNTNASVHYIGNSAIGDGGCAWNETQYGDIVAHLYSTTRFRASITNDESRGWFGTGHGSLSSASVVFGIRIRYPVQYW